jgi:hypothetical protein
MNSIWKAGAAAVTVAMLGGFYMGQVMADPGPLPQVGQPVTVGSTAEPTPSSEAPTLRPGGERTRHGRDDDRDGDHNGRRGGERGDDGNGADNSGRGGDDDDIETIEPSPSVQTFDDHGGDDNSGHGSDDSGHGSDDSGGDDSGGDDD